MIHLSNLLYAYPDSGFRLDIPDLAVAKGEKVAVIGPSGSGKSTLLGLIAGALLPASGSVVVDGMAVQELNDSDRRLFRATRIGQVFQDFELIEYLTVEENIRLPYLINRQLTYGSQQRQHLQVVIQQTGLAGKLHRRPFQLSHGERQRVALCRALITSPPILLADEPTGSLDPSTAVDILQLIINQISLSKTTLLLVTHDHSLLKYMDRTINLSCPLNLRQTSHSAAQGSSGDASLKGLQ